MKAIVIEKVGDLGLREIPSPHPGENEIRIRVSACGVCRTDLHILEGDIPLKKVPIIPGHQVVGYVESTGDKVKRYKGGERVGVAWIHSSCGRCKFCLKGNENLCPDAKFTGYDVDGGYAEFIVVQEDFAYPIPQNFSEVEAAPLLCAGVIGYRSLKLSQVKRGDRLGLVGFGSSAHIVIQVAKHIGCEVFVLTREEHHRKLAKELGAVWVGETYQKPPERLDAAIIFAPVGETVPTTLSFLERGGVLVINAIYMTPIPKIDYENLWYERVIRSVANVTKRDAEEFLRVVSEFPLKTVVETFTLEEAGIALSKLKEGKIKNSAVLRI